jgi:hypothetical protein
MEEGRGEEKAYVTEIKGVELAGSDIKITVASLPGSPVLLNDSLWKLRTDLGIEQFEFNRHHWAIKDRTLFTILAASGHRFDAAVHSRFENRPLPAPPRSSLIDAINAISGWSHTEIDRFLLEADIPGLAAGRDIGSRQDRANAIVKFAIANPTATTAENSLFSAFIVRRSKPPDTPEPPDASASNVVVVDPLHQGDDREASGRSPNRVSHLLCRRRLIHSVAPGA